MNRLAIQDVEKYRVEPDLGSPRSTADPFFVADIRTLYAELQTVFFENLEIHFVSSTLVDIERYKIRLTGMMALPIHQLCDNARQQLRLLIAFRVEEAITAGVAFGVAMVAVSNLNSISPFGVFCRRVLDIFDNVSFEMADVAFVTGGGVTVKSQSN